MNIAKAAVALAFAALPFISLAQGAVPSQTPSDEQAAAAIMDYYPAAARAAGVEGTATLTCLLTERARWTECTLASESPTGFGFGDAALKLAGLSKDKMKVPDVTLRRWEPVKFIFSLKPPFIEPIPWRSPMLLETRTSPSGRTPP
jgi:hypothetical protein